MKVILAAGGTGGHIYPALAFAKYLKQNLNNVDILFVGSKHRVETTLIPSYGYNFIGLDLNTPSGNIFNKIKGYMDAFRAIDDCVEIIDDFKPDVIIGFGGFTCFSMVKAGIKRNVLSFLHEQNSVVGKSNKVLAKKVDGIIGVYPAIKDQLKSDNVYLYGNPRYNDCMNVEEFDLESLNLKNDIKTVVIVMGSLGSQIINEVVLDMINNNEFEYQIVYISGKNYYHDSLNDKLNANIKVIPYSDKLIPLMNKSDLVVGRAGATTLSELMALNKPSIIIPSIHVTDNHQFYNAKYYENLGCLNVIEESDLNSNDLKKMIDSVIIDDIKLEEMKSKIKDIQKINPCEKMLDLINEKLGG